MKYFNSLVLLVMMAGSSLLLAQSSQLKDGEVYLNINGLKHWVKIKGSANNNTPIFIVHGGPGGNNYSFERTIGPKLEAFATIIYYEQRGSGRSEAPKDEKDYALPTLINDLDVLRDSLRIQKMNLLGYSFGAELSLRYALAHPDRVEKLILSSPAELSISNMLVQIQGFYTIGDSIMKNSIENILKDTIPVQQKLSNIWNASNTEMVDKFLFLNPENAKGDLVEKTTGLQIPSLLICGIYDKNGGLHTSISLKQVLPNSILKLYENSAHFPDIEETERFAADVKDFIK